jgi:hypothetical protein
MLRVKFLIVPAVVGLALVLAPTNPVLAQADKTTICHLDRETGDTETIRIATKAEAIHLSHGDILGVCPSEAEKVEICHQAPPNTGKTFTLLVDADEEQEHLDHGDSSGSC